MQRSTGLLRFAERPNICTRNRQGRLHASRTKDPPQIPLFRGIAKPKRTCESGRPGPLAGNRFPIGLVSADDRPVACCAKRDAIRDSRHKTVADGVRGRPRDESEQFRVETISEMYFYFSNYLSPKSLLSNNSTKYYYSHWPPPLELRKNPFAELLCSRVPRVKPSFGSHVNVTVNIFPRTAFAP